MSEKLTFTLTGNFQYDLGILGLKRVLDFFGIEYESDGKFYISIDRDKNKLIEDIIAKLIIDNEINYFWNKVVEELQRRIRRNNSNYTINGLEESITCSLNFKQLYNEGGLQNIVKNIGNVIYNNFSDTLRNEIEMEVIIDIIWQKGVNLVNNILLNFQADMKAIGINVLGKVKSKLNSDVISRKKCSFCITRDGKRLTRDVFFFAPAQYNVSWFNEPNLFICPECLVSNLAITQTFVFLGNKQDAIVAYTPNLSDMETLNSTLKNAFSNSSNYNMVRIFKPIIEYEKTLLETEASVKEIQILSFKLDSQNPLMEMFILTNNVLMNLIKIAEELDNFFNDKNVIKLFAYVKQQNKYIKIDLSRELLHAITLNQKVYYLVQKYSRYCVMSEIFRQNKTRNPPIKGFSAWTFLEFLKIHYKLEDKGMNEFQSFKQLGQRIRQRIYMILTDNRTKSINWNTFDNKIISLSSSFLNASKGSLQQFQELLCRVIITNGLNVNIDTVNIITKENYSEVATTIALALLVAQSEESREQGVSQATVEEI
ncbi:MAG TPA: hypothetical protein PK074_12130 [Spirochaetales bacterium]|nr:hypothetical protein [Spirochaetales bacterium]HQK35464.1 hypothetical protein [Spirochaetales bacterium]